MPMVYCSCYIMNKKKEKKKSVELQSFLFL